MMSLLIMFPGLGIAVWGFYRMWNGGGFEEATPFYAVGGAILFVGMLVNHWEHTRRNG
jgi:hypothetical protein